MRYLVKINDLKEKTGFLEKKLDIIREYVTNLENLKKELDWNGEAKELFIVKYNEYLKEINLALKNLISLILFLKAFYANYNEEYLIMKRKYASLLNEVSTCELN